MLQYDNYKVLPTIKRYLSFKQFKVDIYDTVTLDLSNALSSTI